MCPVTYFILISFAHSIMVMINAMGKHMEQL